MEVVVVLKPAWPLRLHGTYIGSLWLAFVGQDWGVCGGDREQLPRSVAEPLAGWPIVLSYRKRFL